MLYECVHLAADVTAIQGRMSSAVAVGPSFSVARWCRRCGALCPEGGEWERPAETAHRVELDRASLAERCGAWQAAEDSRAAPSSLELALLVESELRPLAELVAEQGRLLRRAVGVVSDHARVEAESRAVLDEFAGVAAASGAVDRTLARLRRPPRVCGEHAPGLAGLLGSGTDGRLSYACTREYAHPGEHVAASSLGAELYRWPR